MVHISHKQRFVSKLVLSACLATCIFTPAFSQKGGDYAYPFVNAPFIPIQAGLGGAAAASKSDGISAAQSNISLLDSTMNGQMLVSATSLFAAQTGIKLGNASYCRRVGKTDALVAIQAVGYGDFERTSAAGEPMGSFGGSDVLLQLSVARHFKKKWAYGASLKPLASFLESTNSLALLLDGSVTYSDSASRFSISGGLSNIGTVIKPYYPGERERLPISTFIALSKRFKHAPLRISVGLADLHQFDLTYKDALKKKNIFKEEGEEEKVSAFEAGLSSAAKHVTGSAQLLLGKFAVFGIGYDLRKAQELGIPTKRGMSGLSWMAEIRIRRWAITYASQSYGLAGGINVIGLRKNIDRNCRY